MEAANLEEVLAGPIHPPSCLDAKGSALPLPGIDGVSDLWTSQDRLSALSNDAARVNPWEHSVPSLHLNEKPPNLQLCGVTLPLPPPPSTAPPCYRPNPATARTRREAGGADAHHVAPVDPLDGDGRLRVDVMLLSVPAEVTLYRHCR